VHRGDHDSTTLIEAIISTADRRAMSVPIRTDQVRDRRVDAAIDSYVDWREQSGTTTAAYEGWTGAPSLQRPLRSPRIKRRSTGSNTASYHASDNA